jgi:hypothetical protein
MLSHNKLPNAILLILLTAVMLLSACKPADKSSQGKNIAAPASKPAAQDPQDPPDPTAGPTATIIYEEGKANIEITRLFSSTSSNSGTIIHSVDGTVPVTFKFNKEKSVWEMKGTNFGAGTTEFTNPECKCASTWIVEITISGVFVPPGALIAEPDPYDGCYVKFTSSEAWEKSDASCNCTIGSYMIETEPEQLSFGPMKLILEDGKSVGEIGEIGNTTWQNIWRLKELDVPDDLNCIAFDPKE